VIITTYYNIYHHVTMDAAFEKDTEKIHRFAGFRIISISADSVQLEKIAPPIGNYTITVGDQLLLDCGRYGNYTITLKSIEG
jgi:hypothetical protein